ncbi:hypothetical protein NST84_08960 [Paenibacillus sp. FSL R7-0345]|uniref:DUF6946 family protein n=1 Tax=Paenibacillus sp. FSL R7-0345 TaxID=2954535 RepID=UPI00315A8B8F
MEIKNRLGLNISNLTDWFQHAPPAKGEAHWVDGRSAKELAKAWTQSGAPTVPKELERLIDSHQDIKGLIPEIAIPECETKLDAFNGNGRKHDLIVYGKTSDKKTLISIEAKADEPFGEVISNLIKRYSTNPRTKVPERIKQLGLSVFGDKDFGHIRYQLLHAVAGTLIEARINNCGQAVFVVHEFVPSGIHSKKSKQNNEDLQTFVELLTDIPLIEGQLIGPIKVIGGNNIPSNIPLYIGKIESAIEI